MTRANTFGYIKELLQIREQEPEDPHTEQKVIINERMRRYLNTLPDITHLHDDVFKVFFNVGEIRLQGRYDLSTHTISEVAFVVDEKNDVTLLIRDFVLPLSEENRNILVELVNNPRLYLRLTNQPAFDKYERMLDEK